MSGILPFDNIIPARPNELVCWDPLASSPTALPSTVERALIIAALYWALLAVSSLLKTVFLSPYCRKAPTRCAQAWLTLSSEWRLIPGLHSRQSQRSPWCGTALFGRLLYEQVQQYIPPFPGQRLYARSNNDICSVSGVFGLSLVMRPVFSSV